MGHFIGEEPGLVHPSNGWGLQKTSSVLSKAYSSKAGPGIAIN